MLGSVVAWQIYRHQKLDHAIGDVVGLIHQMEEKGCQYWGMDQAQPECHALAIEIKRLNKRLGAEISDLKEHCSGFRLRSYLPMTAFRQAVTGDEFEQVGRCADQERIERIYRTSTDFVREIRKAKGLWV